MMLKTSFSTTYQLRSIESILSTYRGDTTIDTEHQTSHANWSPHTARPETRPGIPSTCLHAPPSRYLKSSRYRGSRRPIPDKRTILDYAKTGRAHQLPASYDRRGCCPPWILPAVPWRNVRADTWVTSCIPQTHEPQRIPPRFKYTHRACTAIHRGEENEERESRI